MAREGSWTRFRTFPLKVRTIGRLWITGAAHSTVRTFFKALGVTSFRGSHVSRSIAVADADLSCVSSETFRALDVEITSHILQSAWPFQLSLLQRGRGVTERVGTVLRTSQHFLTIPKKKSYSKTLWKPLEISEHFQGRYPSFRYPSFRYPSTFLQVWAHTRDHPHTEGTFTRTLVIVGNIPRSSGECHEVLMTMVL